MVAHHFLQRFPETIIRLLVVDLTDYAFAVMWEKILFQQSAISDINQRGKIAVLC